jgi:hypothetical protein
MLEIKSLSSHISKWREEQLNLISKQIQQNLRSIQSPPKEECEKIKKIYKELNRWGMGGQISRFITCFLKGYRTKTLVVIKGLFNNYLEASNKTWDEFILPISETCQPNHLLKYEINKNDSICEGLGLPQLTLLLIFNKFMKFRLK